MSAGIMIIARVISTATCSRLAYNKGIISLGKLYKVYCIKNSNIPN